MMLMKTMKLTVFRVSLFYLLCSSLCYFCVDGREEYEHPISFLDGDSMRSMYRSFRDFAMRIIGQTGRRTRGAFLQETDTKFPCNKSGMRSPNIPTSVHRLRPGDIDVIAALGDSLTAASGASSVRVTDLVIENRGLSWSIGGQWSFKNSSTLPNILKEYNPNLLGYSKHDAWTYHLDSQLNLAEIGASSADMPYMAKMLVQRIKMDKRINFKKSWKMVTIAIGGNDICSFICQMDEPESLPRKHKQRLVKTLRYLRDNLPRTFVNIVPTPFVRSVVMVENKPFHCQMLHHGECSCWIGHLYNQNKENQELYHRIQAEMHDVELNVAQMKEFRNLKEFAAVFQPWPVGLSFETDEKPFDSSLLAFDCFHMSQKGHGWAGVALWNNLFEKPGNKTKNWVSPKKRFICPTKQHPYFYTNDNYLDEQNQHNAAIINQLPNSVSGTSGS